MVYRDRMVARHPIEILDSEPTFILDLGVVVEIALYPVPARSLLRFCPQLLDDAVDTHELDLERVAHDHFVQQVVTNGVIVAIDESRHDGHLPRIEHPGSLTRKRLDLLVRPDR